MQQGQQTKSYLLESKWPRLTDRHTEGVGSSEAFTPAEQHEAQCDVHAGRATVRWALDQCQGDELTGTMWSGRAALESPTRPSRPCDGSGKVTKEQHPEARRRSPFLYRVPPVPLTGNSEHGTHRKAEMLNGSISITVE